jgi:hypothetical protein
MLNPALFPPEEPSVFKPINPHEITSFFNCNIRQMTAVAPTHSLDHVLSSGPMLGKSYNNYHKLLGAIQWTTMDIPEKKRKH